MQILRRSFVRAAFGACLVFGFASLSMANDEPVLLVIEDQRKGVQKAFTDADLSALPQITFRTTTVWTEGQHTFSGPSLKSVLQAAGISLSDLKLHALDEYNVTFPSNFITDKAPIIANRMNGTPFPVRQKGPLWLVFPFDTVTAYQSEYIHSLSVWQLYKIGDAG